MKLPHIATALAITLAGTLAASPVAAQAPAASAERVAISYADLDLSSRAGVAALNRRIHTAVQALCGAESDADPHGRNLVIECRHRTSDQAASQARRAIALASRDAPTVLAGR